MKSPVRGFLYLFFCILIGVSSSAFGFKNNINFFSIVTDGASSPEGLIDGLNGPKDLVISQADYVYVASFVDDAVSVFRIDRQANRLVLEQVAKNGISGISGLNGAIALTLSHDEGQLFVVSLYDKSLVTFDIASNGLLSLSQKLTEGDVDLGGRTINGMGRLLDAGNVDVVASSDGKFIYVANQYAGGAVFTRDATYNAYISIAPGTHLGMVGAKAAVLTSQHHDLYTGNNIADAVYHYSRDLQTGLLEYVTRIVNSPATPALLNPRAITASPVEDIIVTSSATDDSLVIFGRNVSTGEIAYRSAIVNNGHDSAGTLIEYMDLPTSLAFNSLGNHLVTANYDADAISLFSQTAQNDLLFKGSIRNGDTLGVLAVQGLNGSQAVAFTHDGQFFVSASYLSDSLHLFYDSDVDEDGHPNSFDAFPLDASEHADLDGDGIGDNTDDDRDGDGVANDLDAFPDDSTEASDLDGDGIGDNADSDRDGDGYDNEIDAFPSNPEEHSDLDNDGVGDNSDDDRDGDGVPNNADVFPDEAAESSDIDGDGVGDNADHDRDGDGYSNDEEVSAGSDPNDPGSIPDVNVSIPPNPEDVASVLQRANFDFSSEIAFLFDPLNPVQKNVVESSLDTSRLATLRGVVKDGGGVILPGVKVTVVREPDFGETATRENGEYDLVINGGGSYTLRFEKAGYLTAQRKITAPWNNYAWVDDVYLVALDQNVTPVAMGSAVPQIAKGSIVSDSDGQRQAVVYFPPGTQAVVKNENGSTSTLSTLSFRATEYTIGANGMERMPGELPYTSGYTYAVELSADEALSPDRSVVFSQPVALYVDNFLVFPTGEAVPLGWYDYPNATWVAYDNGRVIEIIGIENGVAVLDVDGSGQPATQQMLADLGITQQELSSIAQNYDVGRTLWRVLIPHFTPWDCNWPYGPPEDSEDPPEEEPKTPDEEDPDEEPCEDGSIIECHSQVLGEQIPLTGTSVTLNYRSNRAEGRANRKIRTILSDDSIPASLKSIKIEIEIAGQKYRKIYLPQTDLVDEFTWDGLDAYGREVFGPRLAKVSVFYGYTPVYYATREGWEQSFGIGGSSTTIGYRTDGYIYRTREWYKQLEGRGRNLSDVGGWNISNHHYYDIEKGIIYFGDGRKSSVGARARVLEQFNTGTGSSLDYDIAPDGTLWVTNNNLLDHVAPGGESSTTLYRYGYWITPNYSDGLHISEAYIPRPRLVEVGLNGNLFVTYSENSGGQGIKRIDRSGFVWEAVGTYSAMQDSQIVSDHYVGPAKGMHIGRIRDIDISPDGSLFVMNDLGSIYRISPDNTLSKFAGGRTSGPWGQSGNALDARFYGPRSVHVGPDNSVYVVSQEYIEKIDVNGNINRVAGNGGSGWGSIPDYSVALDTAIQPTSVYVSSDGEVLFGQCRPGCQIYAITPNGLIYVIAGATSDYLPFSGFGGAARHAGLGTQLYDIKFDPQGTMYFRHVQHTSSTYPVVNRITRKPKTKSDMDGFTHPSEDGAEVYVFNGLGQHLKTVNRMTNTVSASFSYDQEWLTGIEDQFGNEITINRSGEAVFSITAPNQHITNIGFDGNGYLAYVENPAGEKYQIETYADGLLKSFMLPNLYKSEFEYGEGGILSLDSNSEGGYKSLVRNPTDDGYVVSLGTAEGRTTQYGMNVLPNGDVQKTITYPDGSFSITTDFTDSSTQHVSPDGTVTNTKVAPDSYFGVYGNYVSELSIEIPNGPQYVSNRSRVFSLSDYSDPLSLTQMNETNVINGKTYSVNYNASTSTYTYTSPEGRLRSVVLYPNGKVAQESVPGIATRYFSYGAQGRLGSIQQGSGAAARTTSYTYNQGTGFLSRIDFGGSTWTDFLNHDGAGRPGEQAFSDGRVVQYSYGAMGAVDGVTPPSKPWHSIAHTGKGLEQSYTAPPIQGTNNVQNRMYDLDNRLILLDLASNSDIEYIYNDQTEKLEFVNWGQHSRHYFYYPGSGYLHKIQSTTGVELELGYTGRLLSSQGWTGDVSGTVSVVYNDDLQVQSRIINGTTSVVHQYDNDGLLDHVGELDLILDQNNGLVDLTVIGNLTTDTDYNMFGELDLYTASYNSSQLYRLDVTERDAQGRITQATEMISGASRQLAYEYHNSGRLWKVLVDNVLIREFQYDQNGNRKYVNGVEVAHYDDQDRLLNYEGRIYSYNDDGQLATIVDGMDTTTFDYDPFGNLNYVGLPGGNQISYKSDGANRRVAKYLNGTKVKGFLYQDSLNPIAELDASDNLISTFVYGTRAHVPDYMIKNGIKYRLVSDQVGSVRLVVNTNTGDIAQRLDYDEFGQVLSDTNPGFQPFGFAGGLYDQDTKLVRFGARDYDPSVGRWTAKDPIIFHGGDTNLYAYAHSDPVNFIDPTGLEDLGIGGGMGGTFFIGYPGVGAFGVDGSVTLVITESGPVLSFNMTIIDKGVGVYCGGGPQAVLSYGKEIPKGLDAYATETDYMGGAITPLKGPSGGLSVNKNSDGVSGGMARGGGGVGVFIGSGNTLSGSISFGL